MTRSFPNAFHFAGFNEPSRIECDIYDLVTSFMSKSRAENEPACERG